MAKNTQPPTPSKDQNKEQFRLIHLLDSLGYQDTLRISKEIIKFCGNNEQKLQNVETRLLKNEPWEYVKGTAMFHGHKFTVDKSVLIPRPETETLVGRAISDILVEAKSLDPTQTLRTVDIGTGSGCILLSTLLGVESSAPDTHIVGKLRYTGLDISKEALAIAEKNRELLSPAQSERLDLSQSDLLTNFTTDEYEILFLVANLPYIRDDHLEKLEKSVKDWEPLIALDGESPDGLRVIRRFIKQIASLQNPQRVYLELDPFQVDIISKELPKKYHTKETFPDQFERERFLTFTSSYEIV